MKHKKILLTGASGKLGTAIKNSGLFQDLIIPERNELDVTKPDTIKNFFGTHDFDTIIHCAAVARMKECEEVPDKAIETNIIGTSNLVNQTIKKEKEIEEKIRFIHISTDAVYPGTEGNYSEKSETIPYNNYGWTKLGAECAVKLLEDYCIIRTSFFDPDNMKFETSATDAFSSKMPINELVKCLQVLLGSEFKGTINLGREKRSDYEHYNEFNSSLKECKLKDILETVNFNMAKDASMNLNLWNKIRKQESVD